MMPKSIYFMESEDEAKRLDIKTDPEQVKSQARWAGIKPSMRVADLGCGSGKTSFYLNQLVQPGGETVGIDFSNQRIRFAQKHYKANGLTFELMDVRDSLDKLGLFDFIWIRFLLEYYRSNSFDILKNIFKILKPGGTLCLIDLDYNCLSHDGLPQRLVDAVGDLIGNLEQKVNFDPYAGRKLYGYLYNLGCQNIEVSVSAHHLIYGELNEVDRYNWSKKVETAGINARYPYSGYDNGYEEFVDEFNTAFASHRRFTYTPLICASGIKSG